MKERTQNIAIGITVLVALALLAGLVLFFAGLPWLIQKGYEVKIASDSTHDVHPGDPIHLAGMRVGRVTGVGFTDSSRPYSGITITARIDSNIRLPGNVEAQFFTKGLVGSSYIELKAAGPERIDPSTGKPLKYFPTDGSIVMNSKSIGTGGIPQELTDAMKSLSSLAENINELLKPSAPSTSPGTGPSSPASQPAGLRGTIARLNDVLDAMQTVLGSKENQDNIKTSLANLARATGAASEAMEQLRDFAAKAGTTAENFDDLARKAAGAADEMSRLMATANQIATAIEGGQGTMGMLLKDPQLYNTFLQATRQLNDVMAELQLLVEQWRNKGLEIKLK
jgi:phospholipid/cholesterol/gamma-HCH transport system substrate-binding protein